MIKVLYEHALNSHLTHKSYRLVLIFEKFTENRCRKV